MVVNVIMPDGSTLVVDLVDGWQRIATYTRSAMELWGKLSEDKRHWVAVLEVAQASTVGRLAYWYTP